MAPCFKKWGQSASSLIDPAAPQSSSPWVRIVAVHFLKLQISPRLLRHHQPFSECLLDKIRTTIYCVREVPLGERKHIFVSFTMTPWILQTSTVKICNEKAPKKKKKVSSDFRTIFNLNQAQVCDSFIPWCMTIYNTIACWEQIWRLIWKERKKYPQLKKCATCFDSVALQSQLLMCCDIYQECKFWQIIVIFSLLHGTSM